MNKYIDELTELICGAVRARFPNASLDDGYDVADDVIAKLDDIIAKLPKIEANGVYVTNLNKDKVRECLMEHYPLTEDEVVAFQVIETPTCSECDHYEDHHTSLACATCPVITKVWSNTNK